MSGRYTNERDLDDDGVRAVPAAGVTRRELLRMGQAVALPAAIGGAIGGLESRLRAAAGAATSGAAGASAAAAAGPLTPGPRIYESIGVEPIINCRGTFTIIGGSLELPEVRTAMDAASRHFVQLDELADAVGRRLAELTGAEWGMVPAGCAAALKLVTAACVAGGNPEKLIRLPDLTGFERTEVIIPAGSRSAYDFAIQNVGVTIVRVDTLEALEQALNPRTALIKLSGDSLVPGPFGLDAIVPLARARNVPVLADAAAEVLTIPNVHLQRGATVVAYSGGKAIRGPQCAGLLLGRKDLLMSAWQASAPHHGPGRDNKVGREETLGMLAAVEAWVTRDHAGEWRTWLSWLDTIARKVSTLDGVTTAVREATGLSNRSPVLTVSWNPAARHITGSEVAETLATSAPRIAVGSGGGRAAAPHPSPLPASGAREPRLAADPATTSVSITAFMMRPDDVRIVADRLHGVLSQRREPRPAVMTAPAANVSGRWDVDVQFASSRVQHVFFLEQDGNWIRGSHRTDDSSRDLAGTIEGAKVALQSAALRPATTFVFWGGVSGDEMTGSIDMGEYLTATFTARRHHYPPQRTPVAIPSGRPLSS